MAGEMFQLAATPLGGAIQEDDLVTLKRLLNDGENPMFKDRKGNTYLHYVATMYRPKVFHRLVSTGIEISAQNKHGNTALHVCGLQKECGHVMDLIASGIDPYLKNWTNLCAHEIPGLSQYWQTLHSFYMPGLLQAIRDHDDCKVEFLLKNWCRIDVKCNGVLPRQYAASLGYHDLVSILDRHKTTLELIQGLLEDDWTRISTSSSRYSCNFNMMRVTHMRCHPLQLALRMNNLAYVTALCKQVQPEMVMSDVNSRVHVQGYFQGPLFFESLTLPIVCPQTSLLITQCLLDSRAELDQRDEFGRSFIHLALDRPSTSLQSYSLPELLAKTLTQGARLSDRDGRGLTVRNLAELLQHRELVEFIDKAIVNLFRTNSVNELRQLTIEGYTDFVFELDIRDSYIYAAANETDEVTRFLDWFKTTHAEMKAIWTMLGDLKKSMEVVAHLQSLPNHLDVHSCWRDRGGRCLLHLAIMHGCQCLIDFLTSLDNVDNQLTIMDCRQRNPLHYAFDAKLDSPGGQWRVGLSPTGAGMEREDVFGRKPSDYSGEESFLIAEKGAMYGQEEQLSFLRGYNRLVELIRGHGSGFGLTRREKKKEMRTVVKGLGCSVRTIQRQLQPTCVPQSQPFPDLGQLCLERREWSLLRILASLGLDVDKSIILQVTSSEDNHKEPIRASIREHCRELGKESVVAFFDRLNPVKNSRLQQVT